MRSNPGSAWAEVRIILRAADTDTRVWTAEVDVHAPLDELRDDLVTELGLLGPPGDYTLTREGTLNQPVLALTTYSQRQRSHVRSLRTAADIVLPDDLRRTDQAQAGDVILLPGPDNPHASLRRLSERVERIRADLAGIRPYRTWSTATWHAQTARLCDEAPGYQDDLAALADQVRPEERSGSKWAADVASSVRGALAALDDALTVAGSPEHDPGSARDFQEGKDRLTAALDTLRDLVDARLAFPARA